MIEDGVALREPGLGRDWPQCDKTSAELSG